jgi:cytochrome P450
MMSEHSTESEFDPHYPETFDNSHVYYETMRRKCPVAHSNAFGGFWAAFKYEDVVRIQEDTDSFSTAVQSVVPKSSRKDGPRPPLHFDPPEHEVFRKPINAVFRKSKIKVLTPELERAAEELLAPLVAKGVADFTQEFSELFAGHAFAAFIRLPVEMTLRAREITVRYYRATAAMDPVAFAATNAELYALAASIVEDRKLRPLDAGTDLVSSLLAARQDNGEPIPERLVLACVRQFLPAAQAAPAAVLSSATVHLARDQALQQKLRDNPQLVPKAVEEFLRMYSPYRVFARTAKVDVQLGGRTIKAGEAITMMFPSANRDEDVFPDPHRFDMNRRPNRHIAFGRGPHQCPAAPLARLQLEIGLRKLLAMTRSFELAGEVKMTDWVEFAPSSLPLKLSM